MHRTIRTFGRPSNQLTSCIESNPALQAQLQGGCLLTQKPENCMPMGWSLSKETVAGLPIIERKIDKKFAKNGELRSILLTSARNPLNTSYFCMYDLINLSTEQTQAVQKFVKQEKENGYQTAVPFYFPEHIRYAIAESALRKNSITYINQEFNLNAQYNFNIFYTEFLEQVDTFIKPSSQTKPLNKCMDNFFVLNHPRIEGNVHTDSSSQIGNLSLTLWGKGTSIFSKQDNKRINQWIEKYSSDISTWPNPDDVLGQKPISFELQPGFLGVFDEETYHHAPIFNGNEERLVLLLTQRKIVS